MTMSLLCFLYKLATHTNYKGIFSINRVRKCSFRVVYATFWSIKEVTEESLHVKLLLKLFRNQFVKSSIESHSPTIVSETFTHTVCAVTIQFIIICS